MGMRMQFDFHRLEYTEEGEAGEDSTPFAFSSAYEVGASSWANTYRLFPNDDDACLRATNAGHADGDINFHAARSTLTLARWVDGGCRILDCDETYFAAMAKTTVNVDAASALHVPWPAFAVRLPTAFGPRAVATFGQFVFEGAATTVYLFSTEDSLSRQAIFSGTIADLLFSERPPEPSFAWDDTTTHAHKLVLRGVAGLLFTYQHTTNWKWGGRFSNAGNGKRLRQSPPPHRSIVIGKPLALDLRDVIREEVRTGKKCAPAVQTLVRGHLKRQAVGLGSHGRKVIWVEPYWRGPEDAPILARPYMLGPR